MSDERGCIKMGASLGCTQLLPKMNIGNGKYLGVFQLYPIKMCHVTLKKWFFFFFYVCIKEMEACIRCRDIHGVGWGRRSLPPFPSPPPIPLPVSMNFPTRNGTAIPCGNSAWIDSLRGKVVCFVFFKQFFNFISIESTF